MRPLGFVYGLPTQGGLADAIAREADLARGNATIASFPDGERWIEVHDDLEGRAAVLVISTGPPVDANVMALAFLADAARRAGASPILAVVPYFGYGRSDRPDGAGRPMGAALVAGLLQAVGVEHLVTVDWHNPAVVGSFKIPVHEVVTTALWASRLLPAAPERQVVVAPDAGGIKRASALATHLGVPMAVALKHRESPEAPKVLQLLGTVAGREALVVDDMVTTAATLARVVERLREAGATAIDAAITHMVMAPGAEARLRELGLRRMLTTDTLPFVPATAWPGFEVVSVANLLSAAVGHCLQAPDASAWPATGRFDTASSCRGAPNP